MLSLALLFVRIFSFGSSRHADENAISVPKIKDPLSPWWNPLLKVWKRAHSFPSHAKGNNFCRSMAQNATKDFQ
jgi:hypothetical protein